MVSLKMCTNALIEELSGDYPTARVSYRMEMREFTVHIEKFFITFTEYFIRCTPAKDVKLLVLRAYKAYLDNRV